MIVLDTHAAIWLATEEGLGKQSQMLADQALAEDCLRAIGSAAGQRAEFLSAGVRELPVYPPTLQFSGRFDRCRLAGAISLRSPSAWIRTFSGPEVGVALEQARRDPAHLGAGLYFVLSKAMPKPSSDRDISIGFLLVLDRDLELRARSHGGDEPVAGRHG